MFSLSPELLAQMSAGSLTSGTTALAPTTTSTTPTTSTTAYNQPYGEPVPVSSTTSTAPSYTSWETMPLDQKLTISAALAPMTKTLVEYQPQTAAEQQYMSGLNTYVDNLSDPYGQFYTNPLGTWGFNMPTGNTAPALSPEQVSAYMAKPYEQQYTYGFDLLSNRGNSTGDVRVGYNDPIFLVNNRTGEIVYGGSGITAAQKVAEMASQLTEEGGNKATWSIYQGAPGSTSADDFRQVAYEQPNQSTWGIIADYALPTAGALLAGPIGLSGALGAAAGAAAGSGLSSALQGRSLDDALLRAAISGGLTYVGGQYFNSPSSPAVTGIGATGGTTAASGLGSQLAQTAANGDIIVSGFLRGAPSWASQFAASTLPNFFSPTSYGSYEPSSPTTAQTVSNNLGDDYLPDVVINGGAGSNWGSQFLSGLGSLNFGTPPSSGSTSTPTDSTTTDQRPADEQQATNDQTGYEDIVVNPGAGQNWVDQLLQQYGINTTQSALQNSGTAPKEKSFFEKLSDYYRYGALGLSGLSLLGKLLEGGNDASSAKASGITSPVFSAKLPPPSAGFGSGSFAARPVTTSGGSGPNGEMTMEDWLTYASRPELSFFNYVPKTAATIARAKGGSTDGERGSFAVQGPGTGRSDDIPAVLSDGEYVIDAETVALLGDGSSKAGAKKLDQFRVNVRKHKGAKLAKGHFSANAKSPEKYMAGGRS